MNNPTDKTKTPKAKSSKLVNSYTQAAQSVSTKRSYSQDVSHFKTFAKIPASPEVVAEYLAKFAGVLSVATLQHRLIAINQAHTEKGFDSPVKDRLVKRTMQGIRRTFGVAQRRVRALVKDDLLELLVMVNKQKPLKAARDKAILLIGFAGAFRRSELVALTMADITPHAHGLELLIRRSKTDQEGEGRTVFIPLAKSEERCPVKALQRWLELAGIGAGPLFRPVNRHGTVTSDLALTPQSVALIVKAAVAGSKGIEAAKMVSGHSLRAGFVTEAATIGLQPVPSWVKPGINPWKWSSDTSGQRTNGRFQACCDRGCSVPTLLGLFISVASTRWVDAPASLPKPYLFAWSMNLGLKPKVIQEL